MKYCFFFLVVFLSRLLTCAAPVSSQQKVTVDEERQPYRNSVRRAAIRAPEWRLVYFAKTEQEKMKLRGMLEEIAREQPLDKQLVVADYEELNEQELGKMPLLLVGNELPGALIERTEKLTTEAYNGITITAAGDLLQLNYVQNPWSSNDTTIALSLIYGPDVSSLREQVYNQYQEDWKRLFWNNWDYEVYLAGKAKQKGSFEENGWEPNPRLVIGFGEESETIYTDGDWRIYALDGAPSQGQLAGLASHLSDSRSAIEELFAVPSKDTASIYLYPSVERIGLRRKNMEMVQFDTTDNSLHVVMEAGREPSYGPILEYQLIKWQRATIKEPILQSIDFIDAGLSVLLNDYSATYRGMMVPLAKRKKLFSRTILTNRQNRSDKGSYLYEISAAAWVDAVLDTKKPLSPQSLATLRSKALEKADWNWQSIIAKRDLVTPTKIKEPLGFRKGMTFAHEGYRTYNGYGGSTVDPSLDSLAALNVNALSIVPYTFQRDKNKTGDLPTSSYAGGENDQAVIYSIQRAHNRGWSVMLKPQIWVRNAWPGEIDFATEDEWDQFFTRYTEWITHYAVMAQLEGVDALCIGTEMVRSTIDHPEEWREIIALLRNVYGGRLTYAANWGEEFENLTFWDDLDAIGLNSYYPLSEKEEPTNAELLKGAESWVAKAERIARKYNKKWWLTEVGFRSVKRAWLNPHADAGARPVSDDCQQRCFDALVTASDAADHLTGMYIWKWPSYLGYGRRSREPGTEFTPGGKPAASEVRDFYGGKK